MGEGLPPKNPPHFVAFTSKLHSMLRDIIIHKCEVVACSYFMCGLPHPIEVEGRALTCNILHESNHYVHIVGLPLIVIVIFMWEIFEYGTPLPPLLPMSNHAFLASHKFLIFYQIKGGMIE